LGEEERGRGEGEEKRSTKIKKKKVAIEHNSISDIQYDESCPAVVSDYILDAKSI